MLDHAEMSPQSKPRPVVLGLRILGVCLVFGLVDLAVAMFWGTDYAKASDRTILAIMLAAVVVPTTAIYVTLLVQAWRRRAWARDLLAIWLGGSIALQIYIELDVGTDGPANIAQYATTLFEAIGVALLFTRDARVWYRSPSVAPSAV